MPVLIASDDPRLVPLFLRWEKKLCRAAKVCLECGMTETGH